MTSEANRLDSPPPAISVKARAKEIEARSGAAGKGFPARPSPPVAPQDVSVRRYQVISSADQPQVTSGGCLSPLPTRRCSEGDIFLHCNVHHSSLPTTPKQRRISLENASPPVVPERRTTLARVVESREGSCSGGAPTSPVYQTKTTSNFAPFTDGGKSGVTCHEEATADFRPSIFSTNRFHPASSTTSKQSPLDDIITALEKICDEFASPETVTKRPSDQRYSAVDQTSSTASHRDNDDVFEKSIRRKQAPSLPFINVSNHDVSDKTQWLNERGLSSVAQRQDIKTESTRKPLETKHVPDNSERVKYTLVPSETSIESETAIYRSTLQFSPKTQERHVVNASLQVSPPELAHKCNSQSTSRLCSGSASVDQTQSRLNLNEFGIYISGELKENSVGTKPTATGYQLVLSETISPIRESTEKKREYPVNYFTSGYKNSLNNETPSRSSLKQSSLVKCDAAEAEVKLKTYKNDVSVQPVEKNVQSKIDHKIKKPVVTIKPALPKILSSNLPSCPDTDRLQINKERALKNEAKCDSSPSEELEIVKNILANLDFDKYKRRFSLETDRRELNMEEKSPKPPRAQKTSSVKLKEFFDLLKPNSDNSSNSSKRPFGLCRSSSFTNAETIGGENLTPKFFLQNEDNEVATPVQDTKKLATLPRRKPSTLQPLMKVAPPAPVPAVASCPSIVKLESNAATSDSQDADLAHDEGLVSDSEVGPGAYVTAYVSCVTSSSPSASISGRRGHFRSASDNVTSVSSMLLPEVRIKKTSSAEKLWTSVSNRLSGTEKRKRRKGINCKQFGGAMVQESAKSGTGRSLTYPPQRKSSTSEEEQEFTSVDSNGLKSLKLLTAGLMGSGQDAVRLLSDLSLADSHLCPSEGTMDETYQDVVDSVMHSPSASKHLSVEEHGTSGANGKPHKKKHHSDPGGEACSSGPGDGFIADAIGSSRSEPDLGGNEIITAPSSSCSSASSETSSRATQTSHQDSEDRHLQLKLVIDGQVPRSGQGTWHVRVGSGGSLTSGATPNSRFQFPDSDGSSHRLAIEQSQSSKSPQEQRRYSKRRLRGPYGEMLEEEMRKSGEKQKPAYNDLSFLQDLCETRNKNQESSTSSDNVSSQNRPAMFLSSQSLDDASSVSSKNELAMCVTPKRKISANYPLLSDGENVAIASDEDISPTKPVNDSSVDSAVSAENKNEDKSGSQQNNKEDFKGLTDFSKIQERHSDTRTHVVGELYDTEKSYVESLQILANGLKFGLALDGGHASYGELHSQILMSPIKWNGRCCLSGEHEYFVQRMADKLEANGITSVKYMKPLKSPEYSGIVETGLVDEIFFQIPEILNHHEGFLELLKQRLVNWDSKQKVGDVFVEAFTKQQVIDTYTAFINNWKSAKDAIKLATHAKPAFARFLEHMSREHKGKLTLDALLIMPVQRIPRYELLIKELLKHTHVDHPDHHLLVLAQKEVHDLALKINRMEREAFQQEQMQQRVREIEQLIDGVMDLVQPDRDFIRHDMVCMPGGLGTKKERCLFLFSDVLLITSMKRKSTTMRKPSSASSLSQSSFSSLEMNKYKLLTRFSLDNLDVAKSTDSGLKKLLKDIESLEEDVSLLNQISELISKLNTHQQALEDLVKDITNGMSKQLCDKQTADSQLISLELTVTTQEGVESLTIQFSSPEKRAVWEEAFNSAKQKLALSTDRRPPPEFMHPLPIRKTRAGLQFTCATATLGLNQQGLRDVWVCNSDGYVGQVCVLSLLPEPTVMSCNGVCNARILTIASIPAACSMSPEKNRWRPALPDNMTGVSVEVEEVDEEYEEERPNNGNIQLDSDSSDDDDDTESTDDERKDEHRKRGSSIVREECQDDMDNKQPTMWLGTEDGCIHVYNCSDNIRTKKNKIKIQHTAAIQCIIYLDNRVFVSIANGEVHIYRKEPGGGWCTSEPQKVNIGSASAPVTKMLAVAGKLWCGCQNTIHVLNTGNLQVEHSFPVSSDTTRTVLCMVTSGLGVWIALHHSAILRLFHATSYECLFDINVAPAVTKMLAGCDDIIRQHKAACLRVTAMLACKDLLWVGTSAGVILTLPLPHLTSSTTSLDNIPNVSGLPYGHTGHVRFLACVEMSPGTSLDLTGYNKYALRSRTKEGASGRRASTSASTGSKLLVISGGDGYEDFQNSGLGEAAGRDDSTNHLLLWQV